MNCFLFCPYRKLLEGEECRLSTVSGAMVQSGYPGFSYMSARSYNLGSYRKSEAKPEEEEEEEAEDEEEEAEAEGEEGDENEEEAEEGDDAEGEDEEEDDEDDKQKEKEKKKEEGSTNKTTKS